MMKDIAFGNWILVACSVFYLAWWLITFRPPAPKSSVFGTALLIGAFATGIMGVYRIIKAIAFSDRETVNIGIPGIAIIIGGIFLYVTLLFITKSVFNRQVTSELFIIVGWAILEISTLNFAYSADVMQISGFIMWSVAILVIAVICLVCYIMYYNLPYIKGYIDGCIPLIIVGITMVLMNLSFSVD